jgi:hypothetical protein
MAYDYRVLLHIQKALLMTAENVPEDGLDILDAPEKKPGSRVSTAKRIGAVAAIAVVGAGVMYGMYRGVRAYFSDDVPPVNPGIVSDTAVNCRLLLDEFTPNRSAHKRLIPDPIAVSRGEPVYFESRTFSVARQLYLEYQEDLLDYQCAQLPKSQLVVPGEKALSPDTDRIFGVHIENRPVEGQAGRFEIVVSLSPLPAAPAN